MVHPPNTIPPYQPPMRAPQANQQFPPYNNNTNNSRYMNGNENNYMSGDMNMQNGYFNQRMPACNYIFKIPFKSLV